MSRCITVMKTSHRGGLGILLVVWAALGWLGCKSLFAQSTVPDAISATLVLHGGKIWTGNPDQAEASAIAISGHRIILVGTDRDALAYAGRRTRVIDLDGHRVVPGFLDGHVHFLAAGQLRNGAMDDGRVDAKTRKAAFESLYKRAQRKLNTAASLGITGVDENLDDVASLELYHALQARGELTVRAHVYALIENLDCWVSSGIRAGTGNRFIHFCGLKSQVDGGLSASTAYMFEPYNDDPDNRGRLREDVSPGGSLEKRLRKCVNAGIQPMTHAIGDYSIEKVLDIYERIGGADCAKYRFRIEHAQHLTAAQIKRIGKMGVVISAQPYSVMVDGGYAEKRLGTERCKTTHPFRDLLDAGVVLAFGSDWSGDSCSPMHGIYAAVTRTTLDGKHPDGWFPHQRITVEEALRAYTYGTAYASFFDDQVGSLTPGRLADLVVLDTDILAVEPERIRDTKVLLTIVDGRMAWMSRKAPVPWHRALADEDR